ncbi:MAG: zinc ribbon domain-containing protein [Candidatus Bipolaricaulota bacterium]
MNNNVKKLLDLQNADRLIREKRNQIDSIEARQEKIRGQIGEIEEKEREGEEQLSALIRKSEEKNEEADELQEQINKYQDRLDQGIISFKETEALKKKVQITTDRLEELEDDAINIMMKIDELKEKRNRRRSESKDKVDEKSSLIESLDEEKEGLLSEIEEVSDERKAILGEIPDRLVKQYNRLKSNTNEPVVQIINGVCQGCQMSVSKNTIKKARSDQGIATCENCSRILYIR